jgi:hypothetical protein
MKRHSHNAPTQLTIDAYSCYYVLLQTTQFVNNQKITAKHISYKTQNKMLNRIKKLRHISHTPTICTSNEYTILSSISEILQLNPHITLQYTKQNEIFKSPQHQRCTELAKQAQTLPVPTFHIANTPQIHAELIIDNKVISSDIISTLRQSFSTPPLWEYYKQKFHWDTDCINSIDWKSHGNAIASLKHRQKKTTIQANHRWLPINTAHSLQHTGTARLCPYCLQTDETHEHYLSCNHPNAKQIWLSHIQRIQQKIFKYCKNINKVLIKLIILALTEWRTTPQPIRPSFVTPIFYNLFHLQSIIGWDQILQGQFACAWSTTQTALSQKVPTTWISYVIRTIWHHSYEIWKHRCDINIGTTPLDKQQREMLRLTPKIQTLYNNINQIEPSDKNTIFNHTIKELILLPTPAIENWIYKAEIRIKASIKRRQHQTKNSNHPIQKFFQRVIPMTIPQRRPINTPHNAINPTAGGLRQLISQNITTFFPVQFQDPDPDIPIPKNDLRPP